jgi:hypothetical protein
LFIAAFLLLADSAVAVASGVLRFTDLSPLGTVGDLLLAEVGLLAIVGGLVEISRSREAYEFRRLALGSEEEFSTAKQAEASKRAVVLISTAGTLFLLLVGLALLR